MQTSQRVIRVLSIILATAIAIGCRLGPLFAVGPNDVMIELTLRKQRVEGVPLVWNRQAVCLLGRDGRLWQFAPAEVSDYRKTSIGFRTYPPSEFRSVLLRELGNGYEVSGTNHYLVAHPRDQRDKWASRFEDLYRWFAQYFAVRGFEPVRPPFPLVAVVCRDRAEFDRYATAHGDAAPNGVVGFYDPRSNRITLYDMGAKADSTNWQKNAAVLIHEATHQMAFNTGVHSRYCPPPKWLAEGLATLFEAPGVHDPHTNTRPGDRVNRDRLRAFRQEVLPRHRPELLAAMVATDDLFAANPAAAYAEAWAFSFFLSETEPRKYAAYLKRTAGRPSFQKYTSAERTADFAAIFGSDWRMLEARFLRFIAGVK
jgi:hypothetical protein